MKRADSYMQILDKHQAMLIILDEADDEADSDENDVNSTSYGYGSDDTLGFSDADDCTLELANYIHKINNIYKSDPKTKYVGGNGLDVQKALFLKLTRPAQKMIRQLYKKLGKAVPRPSQKKHLNKIEFKNIQKICKKYFNKIKDKNVKKILNPAMNVFVQSPNYRGSNNITGTYYYLDDIDTDEEDTIESSHTNTVYNALMAKLEFIITELKAKPRK